MLLTLVAVAALLIVYDGVHVMTKGLTCTPFCRPDMNMARLHRSSQRLMLASFDPGLCQWGPSKSNILECWIYRMHHHHSVDSLEAVPSLCIAQSSIAPPSHARPCAVSQLAAHVKAVPHRAGELLACMKELLRVDRNWLPAREGYSLYIRPTVFSSGHSLGIGRPGRTTVAVMLSPVGPYFATGGLLL